MARRASADPRYVARLLARVTAVATIPSVLVYWVTSQSALIALLWIFVPAVYFYIGPILGLLQNVVPARMRATTCALLLFTSNVANLVIAPQLIGWFSDRFAVWFDAGSDSLRWALVLIAPSGFWAAWHLWLSARTIRDDEARVNLERDVVPHVRLLVGSESSCNKGSARGAACGTRARPMRSSPPDGNK